MWLCEREKERVCMWLWERERERRCEIWGLGWERWRCLYRREEEGELEVHLKQVEGDHVLDYENGGLKLELPISEHNEGREGHTCLITWHEDPLLCIPYYIGFHQTNINLDFIFCRSNVFLLLFFLIFFFVRKFLQFRKKKNTTLTLSHWLQMLMVGHYIVWKISSRVWLYLCSIYGLNVCQK